VPAINNFIANQHQAYGSIALYEAVVNGMPSYQSLSGQLDAMPAMPEKQPGYAYHWPTCANTVLAKVTRLYYTTISASLVVSRDSLENAFNTKYQAEITADEFQRSVAYGNAIAQAIYDWSKTDGFLTVNPPYVAPAGTGLWVPNTTGEIAGPYWGNNRPLMAGVLNENFPAPPPTYSTDPSSPFFHMVKEVYDASLVLTPAQQAQGIFWRDSPGGGANAHWISILSQVLTEHGSDAMLDKAAITYVKMGIAANDARIACWKAKFQYSQLRPITYIRNTMGHPTWNPLIATPNHPEYPAAHSSLSSANAAALSSEFGDNYSFTDHTYDYLGLTPRSFNSFADAALDAGQSRLLAGVHYTPSIDAGTLLGTKTVLYMKSKVEFKK
jgi:hypothetical protein